MRWSNDLSYCLTLWSTNEFDALRFGGQMTQWKDIPGYEGYYQASRCGKIRSVNRIIKDSRGQVYNLKGRIRNLNENYQGYLQIVLNKQGRRNTFRVHRLIALTWIGSCPEGLEVCHGELGKINNSIENLRYDTHSANKLDCRRDDNGRFRPVQRSDGLEFINIAMASEFTGCNQSHITNVCRGRHNTCGGYGWSYLEKK